MDIAWLSFQVLGVAADVASDCCLMTIWLSISGRFNLSRKFFVFLYINVYALSQYQIQELRCLVRRFIKFFRTTFIGIQVAKYSISGCYRNILVYLLAPIFELVKFQTFCNKKKSLN